MLSKMSKDIPVLSDHCCCSNPTIVSTTNSHLRHCQNCNFYFDIDDFPSEEEALKWLNKTEEEKEADFLLRDEAMKQIEAMSQQEFLVRLTADTLPQFQISYPGDKDYVSIYRDTNHVEEEYLSIHRNRLRQESPKDYLHSYYLMDYMEENENKQKFKLRTLAMKLIAAMSDSEFLPLLHNGGLPRFIRAVEGDPDFEGLARSPNVAVRDDYYYAYRHRLRFREEDEFKKEGFIFPETIERHDEL